VELRNETQIRGVIDEVDDTMNLLMSDLELTRYKQPTESFNIMFISGKNVRYVEIPDSIDVACTLDVFSEKIERARKSYSRGNRGIDPKREKK